MYQYPDFTTHRMRMLLLILAPLLIYLTSLGHDFTVDDAGVIVEHDHVQAGLAGIGDIFSTNYRNGLNGFNDGLYRPLSLVVFAVFESILPGSPLTGHLTNVLFYCAIILLIYYLLAGMPFEKSKHVAFWTALFFAVMPIHTEVVANIKSLDELLSIFFCLLSCTLLTRYLEKGGILVLIGANIVFLLALFAKESSLSYLAVFPLLWYVFYTKVSYKKLIPIFTSLVMVSAGWLLLRSNILASMPPLDQQVFGLLNNPLSAIEHYPDQLASALYVQLIAIKKVFFPYPLLHDYSYDYLPTHTFLSISGLLTVLFFATLIVLTIWGLYQKRVWAFGLAFYGITVSPVANVIFINSTIFGERLVFTPSLGIALAIVSAVVRYAPSPKRSETIIYLLMFVYAWISYDRQSDWKNDMTLKRNDIKYLDTSARANYNYATELYKTYKTDRQEKIKGEALVHFERALNIYPDYLDALNNRGSLHLFAQEYDAAQKDFLAALAIQPSYSKSVFNLAVTYQEAGTYTEAIEYYQKSIQMGTMIPDAYYGMGYCLGFLGRKDEAQKAFDTCLSTNPRHVLAHVQLGKLFGERGQFESAIEHFKEALGISPEHIDANFYLGITYLNSGEKAQGLIYLKKVADIQPDYQGVSNIIQSIE